VNLYVPGEVVEVNLTLDDGSGAHFPAAYAYRGAALESTVSLSHVAQGRYRGNWTPGTDEDYEIVFVVYSDGARTIEAPEYTRESERWRAIDTLAPVIVDQVWDELLSGHTAAGSAGAALAKADLVEKILRNRLEMAEGDTNNWVLYDDDSVTPLLTWSVMDKDGDGIRMAKYVPARRTRGT